MKDFSENPTDQAFFAALKISKAHLRAGRSLSQTFSVMRTMEQDTRDTMNIHGVITNRLISEVLDKVKTEDTDEGPRLQVYNFDDPNDFEPTYYDPKHGTYYGRWLNLWSWERFEEEFSDSEELFFNPTAAKTAKEKKALIEHMARYKELIQDPFPEAVLPTPDHIAAHLMMFGTLFGEMALDDRDHLDDKKDEDEHEKAQKKFLEKRDEALRSSYIREMGHQVVIAAVTVRNALFIEILGALFKVNKHLLPTDIKFDFHEIIDIGNWDEFIEYSYAKYINTMAWRGGLESQLKFFSSAINCPTALKPEDLELCHQTEAYRHAIVHGSKINETLLRRIPSEELNVGDPIDLSSDYLGQLFVANVQLLNQMTMSAMRYLGAPGLVLNYVHEPIDK